MCDIAIGLIKIQTMTGMTNVRGNVTFPGSVSPAAQQTAVNSQNPNAIRRAHLNLKWHSIIAVLQQSPRLALERCTWLNSFRTPA